ncbi:MAG: HEAT repeat domain-containing protein, partial [Candidatus Coatesbacteria bacterium]
MRRYLIPSLLLISLVAAAGAAEDVSAETDRILRGAADALKKMIGAMNEETVFLFAGIDVGGEFEEFEILERLAESEQGREAIAAACRKAMADGNPYLQLIAYDLLGKAYPEEAAARLPELYDSLGEGDVLMLATIAETALYREAEETPAAGEETLYERLERDLRSDDKAARVKAAKLIALVDSDRARALAVLGMESPDADVRRWCVLRVLNSPFLLAEEGSMEAEAVERALGDDDATVRAFAARQVGHSGDTSLLPLLYPLLEEEEVAVRRAAAASVASLLGYAPTGDKAAAKKLLKRLKAEPDGVTRCALAEAYGEAAVEKEGDSKFLTDDGYWAFFSGQWEEKD